MAIKGSSLDGHVNRCFAGKTVDRVHEDGNALRFRFTNGEQFVVNLATPNGDPLGGTPYLLVDRRCYPIGPAVGRAMQGKTVEIVTKNGISCTLHAEGHDFTFVWVDRNREPIRGEPCLTKVDVSIEVPGATMVLETLLGQN